MPQMTVTHFYITLKIRLGTHPTGQEVDYSDRAAILQEYLRLQAERHTGTGGPTTVIDAYLEEEAVNA